jgi:hypothetical protein
VPAGEIGAADVADLARAHHIVKRAERFLHGRQPVHCVQLEKIDVIRAEPAEAAFDRPDEMEARRAEIVRAVAGLERGLRGDEDLVAAALDRAAEHFLRRAAGVDVGGVKHSEPGVEADVDQPRGLLDVGAAEGLEELVCSAKGGRAEGEYWHAET